MNKILEPLRQELEKLQAEVETMKQQKKDGKLPQECDIVLSCDTSMLCRFQRVYDMCLAEYEKIETDDLRGVL